MAKKARKIYYGELATEVSELIRKKNKPTCEALHIISEKYHLTSDQSTILEEKYMAEVEILIDYIVPQT